MVKMIKPYLTTLPARLSLVYSIRLAIAAPESTPSELPCTTLLVQVTQCTC